MLSAGRRVMIAGAMRAFQIQTADLQTIRFGYSVIISVEPFLYYQVIWYSSPNLIDT